MKDRGYQAPIFLCITSDGSEPERLEGSPPPNAVRDETYTISRHTINGSQVQTDLRRGREAHIFKGRFRDGSFEYHLVPRLRSAQ